MRTWLRAVVMSAVVAIIATALGALGTGAGPSVYNYDGGLNNARARVTVRFEGRGSARSIGPMVADPKRAAERYTEAPAGTPPSSRPFVVAAETGGGAAGAADSAAYDYATSASKLDHIFAAKHGFDPLIEQFGSREAVVQEMLNGVRGLTPASGIFAETVTIGGQEVVVRGAVVDGVVKLGTAFTP